MKQRWVLILLVSLSLGLYANTLQNKFVWDDGTLIVKNRYIRSLKNVPLFFHPSYKPEGAEYRPLREVTFALEYSLWKLNPFGWHLTNIILNALNVLLVYLLALHLFRISAFGFRISAFIAALLFAFHPVHTETVAWVKNITDLICTIFFLSSLILFLKVLQPFSTLPGHPVTQSPSHPVTNYSLSLVCFLLALLSKIMAITLPFILSGYIFLIYSHGEHGEWEERQRKETKRKITFSVLFREFRGKIRPQKMTLPFWGILFLYLVSKFLLPGAEISSKIGLYENALLVFKTVASYLKILVFPVNLCAERLFPVPESIFQPYVVSSIFVILLLAWFCLELYKRNQKEILFSLFFILIALVPVSNILYLHARPFAEGRLYISSLGFCLLLGILFLPRKARNHTEKIIKFFRSRNPVGFFFRELRVLRGIIFFFILFSFGFITVKRNSDWRDNYVLWTKTVKQSPSSSRAHLNLGKAYTEVGFYDRAIAEYEKVIEIDAENAYVYCNLGSVYEKKGSYEQGIEMLKRAIQLNPEVSKPYYNLGVIYSKFGRDLEALKYYKLAIKMNPNLLEAKNMLGILYTKMGLYDEAIFQFERILKVDPNSIKALDNLGVVYYKMGMYKEAMDYYKRVIKIEPANLGVHNNLGTLYRRLGRPDEAIEEYKKALALDPNVLALWFNLGLAYLDKKLYAQAKESFERVLQFDPNNPGARKYLKTIATEATEK